MNRKRSVILAVAMFVLTAAVVGGWFAFSHFRSMNKASAQSASVSTDPFTYVVMDKIVVMLKPDTNERTSRYVVLDIVLKMRPRNKAATIDQLLLLRSVAVQALSGYTVQAFRGKSMLDVTRIINEAFVDSYRRRHVTQPFVAATISKLLAD